MRFGEKLVSLRKSHGYTQENLAEMIGYQDKPWLGGRSEIPLLI